MSKREEKPAAPTPASAMRAEAEQRMKDSPPAAAPTESSAVIVHELRVHQIELEMQNEELKRAHLALEESRDKYVDLYDFAPVGYLTINRAGLIVEANLTGAVLLGVPRQQLLARRFRDFIAPANLERWDRQLTAAFQHAEKSVCDATMCRADGSGFHARLDMCRMGATAGAPDASGKVSFLRVAFTDVTELKQSQDALEESRRAAMNLMDDAVAARKQSEQARNALRKSEARYRMLADNSDDFISLEDAGGFHLYVSPSYHRITGWTPDDLEASDWRSRVHPDDIPALERAKAAAVEGEQQALEHRIRCKNGEWIWVAQHLKPIRNADGHVSQVLLWASNITARKQAETILQDTLQRFYLMLSSMYSGVLLMTDDGRVEFINQAFCDAFGLREAPANLFGLSSAELLAMIKPAFGKPDEAAARIKEILGHGEPVRLEEFTMSGGRTALRDYIPLSVQGQSCGRLWIYTDITKRKRAQEAVQQSQKTFAELIERAPFGIYVIDSAFRIAQMNTASQNGAFRNVRPLIGRDFSEAMRTLWPENVAAEIIGRFRHTLDTGEPYYSPQFINPRNDAEIVESYEWELHRMTLPGGGHGVICYYFDSTKLRQAEAALRTSEDRLRFALETCAIGAWDMDLVDHTASRALQHDRIFGHAQLLPQWTYEMFLDHVIEEDRAAVDAKFRAAIETGGDWNFECRIRRPDGQVRWIWAAGRHRPGEAGAHSRMAGIVQDITARKAAGEKLRESEERFRIAQELSPDGFSILRPVRDSGGRIVDFTFVYENAAIARMNGTDPAAVVGRRISEFLPAHSQSPFHEAHARVADTGEPCIMEQKYEGGDIPRPIWFRVVSVRTGQDIAILSQDITKRKVAEEAIRMHVDELRELNDELTRFNRAAVGRELRLIELKKEVNALRIATGLPRLYKTDFDDEPEAAIGAPK